MNIINDHDKLRAWDFIKNNEVDILEIDDLDERVVNWICPKCHTEFQKEIRFYTKKYSCPKCGESFIENLNKEFRNQRIINFIIISIISLFISFISSYVTIKFKPITQEIIYTFLFDLILLISVFYCIGNYVTVKINKSSKIVANKYLLYELIKNSNCSKKEIENAYLLNISKNILSFVNDKIKNKFTNDEIFNLFLSEKNLNKISWLSNNERREIRLLIEEYKYKTKFYILFASYESKSLINFSYQINSSAILSLIIAIISTAITTMNLIQNWQTFGKDFIWTIGLFILLFIYCFVVLPKYRIKKEELDILNKIAFISSSIFKAKNNK